MALTVKSNKVVRFDDETSYGLSLEVTGGEDNLLIKQGGDMVIVPRADVVGFANLLLKWAEENG